MVEAGQAYSTANQLFLSGLAELSIHQKKDNVVTVGSYMMLILIIIMVKLIMSHDYHITV